LDEEGVDHWLVDRQVDFCGEEGGIDVFLSFRSEGDFLRRFFSMVLPKEDANQTRRILVEALEKQADRPRAKQRVALLRELAGRFSGFAEAAGRLRCRLQQGRCQRAATAVGSTAGKSGRRQVQDRRADRRSTGDAEQSDRLPP